MKLVFLISALLSIVSSPILRSETVSIGVFEEHEKYLYAADAYRVSWRILDAAAHLANIELQPHETSWQGGLNRLNTHKTDLMFAAYRTPERQQWGVFSLPLAQEGAALFTRHSNSIESLEDIDFADSVIGVSANSLHEDVARELGFENIYSAVRRPQLYKMLNEKRVDYLLFGRSAMSYFCVYYGQQKKRNCAKQIGPLFQSRYMHALAVKDNKRALNVLEKLNKAILELSKDPKTVELFDAFNDQQHQYDVWLTDISVASN